MNTIEGEIYGGLLINLIDPNRMEPVTFPFTGEGLNVKRGNQTVERGAMHSTNVEAFDFWHSNHSNAARNELLIAERAIHVDGRMVGQDAENVLRKTLHQVLTMNAGVRRKDRLDMLEMASAAVMPTLTAPAFISMEVQSSQPKFILFSREIPIHMNVFCDEACMLLVWSNEAQLEHRMREHYGNRFVTYRMPPIVNSACVLQTYYLKKRMGRWKYEMRGDNLRVLNALEAFIFRRAKPDPKE